MMNGPAMTNCLDTLGMMGFPMGVGMGLLWLLLIGLLVWGIYRLVSARGATRLTGESPLDTLRRRYAEGKISTEEYEERKEILSS